MKITKTIGTHSGVFHADDVTACMMLTRFTKEFMGAKIIRTRDKEVLKKLNLVVDVGGEYDPSRHRYDHHQKGFNETFSEKFKTKLSGSGLIFKHFGEEIIRNSLEKLFVKSELKKFKRDLSLEDVNVIKEDLYEYFFEFLDGVDNGISRYPKSVKPLYRSNGTNLCGRVGRLNPNWWLEETPDLMELFGKGMDLAEEDYLHSLMISFANKFISFDIVKKSILKRHEVDPSGQIVRLY